MQSELPLTSSSSLSEMRALIAERGLPIKTTGKGRSKKIIFAELVALCSSDDGCEASEPETTEAPAAEMEAVEAANAEKNTAMAAEVAIKAAEVAAEIEAQTQADAAVEAAEKADSTEALEAAAAAQKVTVTDVVARERERPWWEQNVPY